MLEDLKKNLEHEKGIIVDMRAIAIGYQNDSENRKLYLSSLDALAKQLDLLNNAVPHLMKEGLPFLDWDNWEPEKKVLEKRTVFKKKVLKKKFGLKKKAEVVDIKKINKSLGDEPKKMLVGKKFRKKKVVGKKISGEVEIKPKVVERKVVRMSYVSPSDKKKKFVTIDKNDRKEFLKKLKMSEESLKSIRKIKESQVGGGVRKANPYISFSSKYFGKYGDKMSRQFDDLARDLKKANIPILLTSYLSMAMMSCVLAFAFGFLVFLVLIAFSLSNFIYILLPFGFVGLTMAGFYLYPSSQASSVHKSISYELPFSTIHMAAIAGSNITPVKIFKIIAASVEYPNVGAEMRKVIVQIDVYGYDMVTSLKNVAKTTSNAKLSELFSGLASNISSGGALKNYLEKKSESFLVDYRLERQKYSALAGTFMDVYISILIAAPLILMMMFIVMNVAGLGMGGLSIMMLMSLAIGGIIITNIIFIVVLNMKQPRV